jgi:ferric-dicitrate binding protein FerR (iron transport regulator)
MSHTADRDLEWQAYLYVSGEMSPPAVLQFEERLADDQAAREAVAQAVELWTLLAANPQSAIPTTVTRSHRSAILAALTTVAALVIVFFSVNRRQPPTQDGEPASELVSLWTETDEAAEDDVDAMAADAPGEADDLTVPGWMIAALETDADDDTEEN